ncbi:PH and SEC7 domain-containing protein 1-like [Tachysurus fulvidraco]|uniref:PH and SEC7 domain-containing protein 1-like n=1 Tax=Tachysurus fulvidraco TaxID=1234273 RepID=UPI001FEFA894|nr:PH and SEC7 domain-containing protein 1-like [Tachysurus fulvidraco]
MTPDSDEQDEVTDRVMKREENVDRLTERDNIVDRVTERGNIVDRVTERGNIVDRVTDREEIDDKANEWEEDEDSSTEWEDAATEWEEVEDEDREGGQFATEWKEVKDKATNCKDIEFEYPSTKGEGVEDISTKCKETKGEVKKCEELKDVSTKCENVDDVSTEREEVKVAETKCEESTSNFTESNDTVDEALEREEVTEEEGEEAMSMEPVHKIGHLICKRVMDENGTKTSKGQRAWKPFTAVLQGMVLHLQKDNSNSNKTDKVISLHHTFAYPVDHKKRRHVLCLRTADLRQFYFQAESEKEQASWVAAINCIAACYSAPPLTPVSHDKKAHCPLFLPSFQTNLSLDQQLECYMYQFLRASTYIRYFNSLPIRDGALSLDYMVQERTRYKTYVKALQRLVATKGAREGFGKST